MALIRPCSGVVVFGANTLGELRGYSMRASAARKDASIMGACVKRFGADPVETTGTLRCYFDNADTAQTALQTLAGTATSLELRPNGTGSGKPKITMSSTQSEEISIEAEVNGEGVTCDFNYYHNGAPVFANQA